MTEENESFFVWFDQEIQDHFWLEDSPFTKAFLDKLRLQGVEIFQVSAPTPYEALNKVFPDRSTRPASSYRPS